MYVLDYLVEVVSKKTSEEKKMYILIKPTS